MNAYSKWATITLLAAGLATGTAAAYAAHDEGGESSSGHSGGKGKGPKYMGGDRGSSHGSSAHKGGSSHHDGSAGGSKSAESKIFHGKSGGHDEGGTDGGHVDGGTEHTH